MPRFLRKKTARTRFLVGAITFPVRLAVLAVVVVLSTATSIARAQSDVDEDGLSDAFEQQLIDQFRPILLYTSWDEWAVDPSHNTAPRAPASVDWYVRHCRLRYPDGGATVFTKAELAADPLLIINASFGGVSSDELVVAGPSEYHLDPDSPDYRGQPPYYSAVGTYGHVVPVVGSTTYAGRTIATDGSILVQYWQFFPYNDTHAFLGDIANHEGDWLYLDLYVEPLSPHGIRYAVYHHHGDGECPVTVLPLDRPLPADNIPRCYIEEGSHEWWPFASGGGECSFSGFGNNGHNGEGPIYRTANVKNLGERDHPMPDPEAQMILRFNGKWGNDSDWFGETPPGPRHQFYPAPPSSYPPCHPELIVPSAGATCRGINGSLSWRGTATSYRVQLGTDPTFASGIVHDVVRTTTSYGYGPLAYDAVYYWRVRNNGPQCAADQWSITRSFRTAPPPPSGLAALLSPPDGATALPTDGVLEWSDVPGATRYGVSIRCPSDEVVASTSLLTSSSYTYSLAPGEYEWFATAYNACGQTSGQSPRRSFTVGQGSPCQVPALLSPASGATCVQSGDTLRWNGSSANYFLRLRSRHCDSHEIAVTGNQYVLGSLSAGEVYYWSVRESCECATAPECFSFRTSEHLQRPNLVSPGDGANDQPVIGALTWNPVSEAVGYRVQLGTACGEGPEVDVPGTSYSYSGLSHEQTYFWRVAALDSCGTPSDYSACRDFDTAPLVSENRLFYPTGLAFAPGQFDVDIPVLGENLDTIQAYELRIRLNPDVFSFTGVTLAGTRSEGGTIEEVVPDANNGTCRIRVSMGPACAPGIPPGSGELLHVRASVLPTASPGSSSLRFEPTPRRFTLCTGATVSPRVVSGSVQIAGAVDAQWSAGPEDAELEVLGANPSMTGASLRMGLPTAGPATVGVFDLMGRSVATIADGFFGAGWHAISWDGRNRQGRAATAGVFIVRLVAGDAVRTQRVTMLR